MGWSMASGCGLSSLHSGMLPESLRSCGRAAVCSLGSRMLLPQAPAHSLFWPGGGRAEILCKTEAQRDGKKGKPDWDALIVHALHSHPGRSRTTVCPG